jgi:hypothetical protein
LAKPDKIFRTGSGLGSGAKHGGPDESSHGLPRARCCFADLLSFVRVNARGDQCLPLPVF